MNTGQRGYTFIEALVTTSVFVLLLGTVVGLLTTFGRQHRLGTAKATLVGETQNVLDQLEREVRTGSGSTFWCDSGLPGPAANSCTGDALFLVNQNGVNIRYVYDMNAKRLWRELVPVTTPAVEVRQGSFTVTKAGVDPGTPPQAPMLTGQQGRVTVRLQLCPPKEPDERHCLFVQTTLTSRQHAPK